jgi:hypothetical protein
MRKIEILGNNYHTRDDRLKKSEKSVIKNIVSPCKIDNKQQASKIYSKSKIIHKYK